MPPWLAAGFGLLVAGALALVFPFRSLEEQIARDPRHADPLQIAYLQAWLTVRPDRVPLRFLLARQLYNAGDTDAARAELALLNGESNGSGRSSGIDPRLAQQVQLLDLDIDTQALARLDPADPAYARDRDALHARLAELAQRRMTLVAVDAFDLELARRAVSLGARDAAARLYARILASTQRQSAGTWEEAARMMLGLGDARMAADLYLAARAAAPLRTEQRRLFMAALRALQGAGELAHALDIAERELGGLAVDTDTLEFLTRLALAANRPDLAQRYAQMMLKLSLLPAAVEALQARGEPVPPAWLALLARMEPALLHVQAPQASTDDLARTPQLPFDDARYTLAWEVFVANNNLRDALAVAQAAVRQRPRDARWRLRLAQVADWSGQAALALEQWHAMALASGDAKAWAEVERRAPQVFDTARWLQALRFSLSRRPRDFALLRQVVTAYEQQGEPAQAIALLREVPAGTDPIERRQRLELLVQVAERSGDDALRARTLRELVRDYGPRLPYALGLAQLAYARGDYEAAFAALAPAARNAPAPDSADDVAREFWDAYAEMALATGRRAEAERAWRLLIASPAAQADDYAALAALLERERPLEAAQLAEAAFARYGVEFQALQAFFLYGEFGNPRDVRGFLERLTPAQRDVLARNPRFLLQRASFLLREGDAAAALRDVRASLAIDPSPAEARALLVWSLLAAREREALRAELRASAPIARGAPELAAPYAAAWLALQEPRQALHYLMPQAQSAKATGDPLWLSAAADAWEQLGQADLAWQLRRLAWLAPAPRGRDAREQRQFDLQTQRRRLALASGFASGDAARARAQRLLADDPTARSGEGRDALLGYALSQGLHELAQAWLDTQYRTQLARPGWGDLATALAADDRPRIAQLLDTVADWLPLYDRVDAAARVGRRDSAQGLAFDALAALPDNEPLHQRLVDNSLSPFEAADAIGIDLTGFRQRPIEEWRYELVGTQTLGQRAWVAARAGTAERRSLDSAQLADPPRERSAALTLGWRGDEARQWQASLQQRDSLAPSTGLALQGRWALSPRLAITGSAGLSQPATDNALLRVGGERDLLELGLEARPSLREFGSIGLTLARLDAQGGGRVGDARFLRAEAGHRLRLEYPDLAIRLSLADLRYSAAGGLATALLPLLPEAQRPFASNASLLPASTTQVALRLTCGERALAAYTRAWRFSCGLGVAQDSDSGLSTEWQFGARGSVIGTDQLWLTVGGGSARGATRTPYTEVRVGYRWLH